MWILHAGGEKNLRRSDQRIEVCNELDSYPQSIAPLSRAVRKSDFVIVPRFRWDRCTDFD